MPKQKNEVKFGDRLRDLDVFGMDQQFNIDGKDKIRTTCGGCMSVLLFCILFSYGTFRFLAMATLGDTFVTRTTRIGYYDETDIFT